MFKAKYIISKHQVPVVFSEVLTHADVARLLFRQQDILGAGFCYVKDDKYHCYGESISLGVKSNGQEDATILNRYLGCSNGDY